MAVTLVDTDQAVDALLAGLLAPTRAEPWCIISTPFSAEGLHFDADEIDREVGDLCRVFLLTTGDLSRRVAAGLPDRCEAYGGAARSFPPGGDWMLDAGLTQLRWIQTAAHAHTMTERLVADLYSMAFVAGIADKPVESARREVATVLKIVAGTRGMVRLASGDIATIVGELTFANVPLEWVIHPGQQISGSFDPSTRRFTPDAATFGRAELLAAYPPGSVTLALVVSADRQAGSLAIHPALTITIDRADLSSNRFDRVDLLISPGDVVLVRVTLDARGKLRLQSHDIGDDEEVLPATSVFAGGEPWLHADRVIPAVDDPPSMMSVDEVAGEIPAEPAPAAELRPRPGPGARPVTPVHTADVALPVADRATALQSAHHTIAELKGQIQVMRASAQPELEALKMMLVETMRERDVARERAKDVAERHRETQSLLRKERTSQTRAPDATDRRARFTCDEHWVEHEVTLAWIDRLPAPERTARPLPPFIVGPDFASSLLALDAGQFTKSMKAVVDILTTRGGEAPGREVHALRSSNGAGAGDVVRVDGATCYRAYVEQNTPSARRLHFWKSAHGVIELSRVVLHDDVTP